MAGHSPADRLFTSISRWLEARPEVRAAILTGSRARHDGTADELSDIDVELFLDPSEPFTESWEWLSEIGALWVCLPLRNREGYPTRLAIFEGGAKADFTLYPAVLLRKAIESGKLPARYARDYRVLADKEGLAAALAGLAQEPAEVSPPGEEEFRALVEEFWFEAYHVAKYLRREDLWAVKSRDWGTKELLLTMIVWHARCEHGWSYETHHLGMRMREWVAPDVWDRLHSSFGGFESADGWRALDGTLDLFGDLAREVADRLGLRYPQDVERNLRGHIDTLRGDAKR